MTDVAGSKDGDLFWGRVRSALGALRPVRHERQPAYGQAAIARSLGMRTKLGSLIEEELAQGWTRAASKRVSLSLMVIEIDRSTEYLAAYDGDSADATLRAVIQTIADTLPREGDSCLRLGRAGFVVVLPDLPALMAKASAMKIADAVRRLNLAHKESHAGVVTVSIGLAVINPRGTIDRKFFEAGAEALKKALRKGIGRLEAVDLRPAQERKRKGSKIAIVA